MENLLQLTASNFKIESQPLPMNIWDYEPKAESYESYSDIFSNDVETDNFLTISDLS